MAAPLFLPFRALGYITDSVPFAVQRRGKETFVTVSVGKSWQVWSEIACHLSLFLFTVERNKQLGDQPLLRTPSAY